MYQIEIFVVGDTQKHNRQIAGYSERPKRRLGSCSADNRIRRRPQRLRCMDQMPCETLEQPGFARRNADVTKLHLCLGPRKRRCTLERSDVTVLVDKIEQQFARRCNDRPEGDPYRRTGSDTNTAAHREDRIEYGARRARKCPPIECRHRCPDTAAASEKSSPVGFDLDFSTALAIQNRKMRGPHLGLVCRATTARRQYCAFVGEVFRSHEQL